MLLKEVAYSPDALKALMRMPSNTARLIRSKVLQYASDPGSSANNVKALKGMPGLVRLRVGDWRVIFRETGEVVAVTKVAPRGGAYD